MTDGKQSKWFCLRVVSNKERKIKERIDLEVDRAGWRDIVAQVLLPTEKIYKIRNGKKVVQERTLTPGYLLIEISADEAVDFSKYNLEQDNKIVKGKDKAPTTTSKLLSSSPKDEKQKLFNKKFGDVIQMISDVKDVIHFLGHEKPIPMKEEEVKHILGKIDKSEESGEALAEPFIVGEEVKVVEGPFQNFLGTIQEVNEEKKKLKVIIKVFGRGTEVELNFMQVEKQS